ncbi:cadmium resistance transporter [Kitasatospora sp. NBC_01287]|uniref:cadmium resistance transporter n=1 Tax=Kitasatospora sp. NBC_01287 TaxID=2903573 RepID=UPI002256D9D5|nr:cadmium resistance transporter [Kitasatospora sp. NBC_01287]MCX4750393.1 cadmium resistance transporter [Kitasatospora sp. NBC_01287]
MTGSLAWAATAAAAFGATNVDNLVLLTLQLAGRHPPGPGGARDRASRSGPALRGQYLALLVLLALSALGAAGLLLLPARGAALVGLVPLTLGVRALLRRGPQPVAPATGRAGTGAVALLALTCGADNVAVYTPLLARAGFPGALVPVAVFAALVPVLCGLALWLARRTASLGRLRALGERVFPAFLITVGLVVLRGALL